jgi:hypothetical protein
VAITTGTRNGLGHVYSDATANVTVTASNATNPRVDQIILRWNDSSIPTGSGNVPTLEVLTGTATAGATLDNRTGAAALPNDCLRLADILVPAASTSVTTANIRDRRPWARGVAFFKRGDAAGNIGTTSTTVTSFAAGSFDMRLECSGTPLDFDFNAMVAHTIANGQIAMDLYVDGVATYRMQTVLPTANGPQPLPASMTLTPTAGSHLFALQWLIVGAGTGTVFNTGLSYPVLRYREQVRQNANNT